MYKENCDYDIVIKNGRVIDPADQIDSVANVGIANNTVVEITNASLEGRSGIDAKGLVVAPGFIDMHSHGQDDENYKIQALDGVTTALELEVGTANINTWYDARAGKSVINYGASIGHIPIRMQIMNDRGGLIPTGDAASREATDHEISIMKDKLEHGLNEGALAVGLGVMYTPNASRLEILEVFRMAGKFNAACHIHLRGNGGLASIDGIEEAIRAATISGAPLHVVHVQSTGSIVTDQLLEIIHDARIQGLDVTTECYPYTASMTGIESPSFDDGWQKGGNIKYEDLEWPATGERLTEKSFSKYRKTGGMVIIHATPEHAVNSAVTSPLTSIASDGYIKNGIGHPRTAGTYSRILGRFVRESNTLTLTEAIRKMSLMPAQRLEHRTPSMNKKGRISVGSNADIVIFNPKTVIDRANYQKPTTPPTGIIHLLVNGVHTVNNSLLIPNIKPGKPVRAPILN